MPLMLGEHGLRKASLLQGGRTSAARAECNRLNEDRGYPALSHQHWYRRKPCLNILILFFLVIVAGWLLEAEDSLRDGVKPAQIRSNYGVTWVFA